MSHTIDRVHRTFNRNMRHELYEQSCARGKRTRLRRNSYYTTYLNKDTKDYSIHDIKNDITKVLPKKFVKESGMLVEDNDHYNKIGQEIFKTNRFKTCEN